jgi:hypothetical protein
VDSKETSTTKQRLGKHVPAAMNTKETIEVLLETIFSIRSMQSGYKRRRSRVEAGSNTSIVALRVVGGDEKENLESETDGHESHGTQTLQ